MPGVKDGQVRSGAVIIHYHQTQADGWHQDRGRKRVLSKVEFGLVARIVHRVIGQIAENSVRRQSLSKFAEAVFKRRDAESGAGASVVREKIQQVPETGG